MKALLIGGTGTISLPISRKLVELGWDVTLLNRGSKNDLVPGAHTITCDINDVKAAEEALEGKSYDVVAQFVAYKPEQVLRDISLFTGKTRQYIFISSASAYAKPARNAVITESTPLYNPYWQYSRDKAKCENVLNFARDVDNFPMTIVRPSHTYGLGSLPLSIHGGKGPWQIIDRILKNKPVLIPGDGTSLWTVTWSEDFADAFIGLMGNDHAIGEAVHITSDEALTWNQIHRLVCEALDRPFIPCHVPSTLLAQAPQYDYAGSLLGDKANCAVFDNSKIKRLVPGFTAKTRFDQGMRKSLEYLTNNKEKQIADPEFDRFCDKVADLMQKAEAELGQGL